MSSTAKKRTKAASVECELMGSLRAERLQAAKSVLEFDFKKKRIQILSKADKVREGASGGILYWMYRDCRIDDNWALLFAQKLALKNELPLHILYCFPPKYLEYTLRHYTFLFRGLEEVEAGCKELNISFHAKVGEPAVVAAEFVEAHHIGGVVVDFLPLRDCLNWQESVLNQMPEDVPFIRVDAHNIVPCWVASDKLEYAARTIRNKINNQLSTYLTEFPPVIPHPHGDATATATSKVKIDWHQDVLPKLEFATDDELINKHEVEWAEGGSKHATAMLESFKSKRVALFAAKRNDPCMDALSNLSPWLHFGHIAAQRCVLVVRQLKQKYTDSVNSYCEEVIVRRELSDNFCFYNINNYDKLEGAPNWAQETLKQHSKDKRVYVYDLHELTNSRTHDDLWNSAQIELVRRGKLHGFMRMYWAKKVLEWSSSPAVALQHALYLNDHFALDGNDPNGYVGVMWSICGVHDQGWAERDVFGKIRYMNYNGCKRKFDIKAYIARWGGKEYNKKQQQLQPPAKKARKQ